MKIKMAEEQVFCFFILVRDKLKKEFGTNFGCFGTNLPRFGTNLLHFGTNSPLGTQPLPRLPSNL